MVLKYKNKAKEAMQDRHELTRVDLHDFGAAILEVKELSSVLFRALEKRFNTHAMKIVRAFCILDPADWPMVLSKNGGGKVGFHTAKWDRYGMGRLKELLTIGTFFLDDVEAKIEKALIEWRELKQNLVQYASRFFLEETSAAEMVAVKDDKQARKFFSKKFREFWKYVLDRMVGLPCMRRVVQRALICPVTSWLAEHGFSVQNAIKTDRRASLDTETLEKTFKAKVGSEEGIDVPEELKEVVNVFFESERRSMRKSRKRPFQNNYYKNWNKPKRAKPELDLSLYKEDEDRELD